MLSGQLRIDRFDNGWALSWSDARTAYTHREVFAAPGACLDRIAEVIGCDRANPPEPHGAAYDAQYSGPADAPSPADGD